MVAVRLVHARVLDAVKDAVAAGTAGPEALGRLGLRSDLGAGRLVVAGRVARTVAGISGTVLARAQPAAARARCMRASPWQAPRQCCVLVLGRHGPARVYYRMRAYYGRTLVFGGSAGRIFRLVSKAVGF